MSDEELDIVRTTAAGDGVALGAWLGELAVRSADRAEWSLRMSRRDVVRQLVRVRLDVSLLERVLAETDDRSTSNLVEAVLQRLDGLIGRVVDEPSR